MGEEELEGGDLRDPLGEREGRLPLRHSIQVFMRESGTRMAQLLAI